MGVAGGDFFKYTTLACLQKHLLLAGVGCTWDPYLSHHLPHPYILPTVCLNLLHTYPPQGGLTFLWCFNLPPPPLELMWSRECTALCCGEGNKVLFYIGKEKGLLGGREKDARFLLKLTF